MENYEELITKQRNFFLQGKTMDVTFRITMLKKLQSIIRTHEQEIMSALKADLNKSEFDAYLTEIGFVLEEIRFTLKHLRKWVKPKKVKSTLATFGSKGYIYSEPYGVALIIAPWNYPFQLAVAPLIGAIAAGNCAIIKPSELTSNTSAVLHKLMSENFPSEYIKVVEGGIEASTSLLKEKFDYIFFTGSESVGKIIMEAAAKNLTPVTLELGGKSPCIVHEDAHLKLAAKRIAWGKFVNAGQTCVAPDYLFVHKNIKNKFLQLLKEAIYELYSEDVSMRGEFTKIVSKKHFERLITFLHHDKMFLGGKYDSNTFIIEPTVLHNISFDDPIMKEEIFGPILPIIEYEQLPKMIDIIKSKPKPLSLYLFSESKEVQQMVLNTVSFGGGCLNDTVYHLSSPYLPFGGVGESGMGAYHGKGSFNVFSHQKSILRQTTLFDLPFRYSTTKNALKMVKMFLK